MRRPDGGTQPLRTAEQLVTENKRARHEAAVRLAGWRNHRRQSDITREQLIEFNRIARKIFASPPKLTVAFCRHEASQTLQYARTPIGPNPLDTEYYSACGWEDAELMQRDYALDHAIEMFRVWKWLKAQKGNKPRD